MAKDNRSSKHHTVQIEENFELLPPISSIKNEEMIAGYFWKSIDAINLDDLKHIMWSHKGNFEIFFAEYQKNHISCFEKLCSTPNMDKCIEIFLNQSKTTVDKITIEKNYLNNLKSDRKGPLQYAILSENLKSVCLMCSTFNISKENILKSIDIIDDIIKKEVKNRDKLEDYKNVIRYLLKFERDFTIDDWNKLFDFAIKNYTDTTLKVLIGFLPDVKLDSSIEKGVLEKVPEKTRTVIKLFEYIQNEDQDSFVTGIENILHYEEKYFSEIFCTKNKFYTLLQLASEKGLVKVVEVLLETTIDRNFGFKEKMQPIFLAFVNGHHKVLSLLFNDEKVIYNQEILNNMINELIFRNKLNDENSNDLMKCLSVLKNDKRASVIKVCSIFLIKTIDSSNESTVLFLLRNGASLNFTYEPFLGTSHNEYVLENLSTKTLDTFLNDCLVSHREKNIMIDEVFIDVNYSFIKPIVLSHEQKQIENDQILPEMEILLTMSKIQQLRPLIKHPVIQSFLYLKWQKMKSIFYINFAYFFIFWLVLTIHIFLESPDQEKCNPVTLRILMVLLFILIIKEVVQVCTFPLYYLKSIENCLEVTIIVTTAYMVFIESKYYVRMHFGVLAILISSSQLILLMAEFPTFSVYFTMLKKVMWNFFRFLAAFFIIFICFAQVLYKIFHINNQKILNNQTVTGTNSTQTQKYDYFLTFERALFKTLIMFAGELEATNFEYSSFPVMSYVMFVIFVFIVTIVLYNFLNGLAISDVQAIKNDAELVCLVGRIEVMSYVERMIFGVQLRQEASIRRNCLKRFFWSIFSKRDLYHARIKEPSLKYFAKWICLFPDISQHNKIRMSLSKPLKGNRYLILSNRKNDLLDKDPIKIYPMDKKIVNLAHLKVKERFENEKSFHQKRNVETKLQILEENQLKQEAVLLQILEILQNKSSTV